MKKLKYVRKNRFAAGCMEQQAPLRMRFHQEQQQQEGGPATLTQEQFQRTVLDGVKSQDERLKTLDGKMTEVTSNFENVSKETKKAFEELTRVQKETSSIQEKLLAIQKAQLAVHKEVRSNWGDPVARIQGNEIARLYLNSFVRSGIIGAGDKGINMTEAMTKALAEGSGEGQGWLLPEIAAYIYEALPDFGIWNTLGVEPMGTKQKILPVSTADPIAYVLAEGAQINDDANMTGTTVTATAAKLAVLLNVSRELLQDSEYDVTARVVKQFLRAVAKRMDYCAFMSNGTADQLNGGFTGVFNFGTVVTAATGNTTVEKFSFMDVYSAVLGVAEAVLDRAARWWMHPFILIRMLAIKDANGRPIFLNALEAPTPGGLGSILGYPVTLGHILPTTNSAGQPVAAFGDPEAYTIGRRQDYEFDFSDHARWTNDQRSFRGIARAAFQGRLNTALTVLTTASS